MSGKIGSGLIFSALMAALITPAFGAEQNHCDYSHRISLQILASGDLVWDGVRVTGRKMLIEKLKARIGDKVQLGISIDPDRHAKYDVVAQVLKTVQDTGFHCIGFTGLEQ